MYKPILFFSLAYFVCFSLITAQGNFYSEGTVNIHAGASIEITGNTTLYTQVDGDGAMVMLGISPQYMQGPALYMQQLVLENNAEVHLLDNTLVEDSLHLTHGHLYTEDAGLYLGDLSNSTGNALGFIITNGTGQIHRRLNTNSFTFHVGGTGIEYFPITIAEMGTADTFALQTLSFLPDDGTATGSPINNHVALYSYSFTDQTAGGNNLTLTMQWNNSINAPDFAEAYATGIHYNGTAYEEIAPCPVNVSTIDPNMLTYQNIAYTGRFGIGDSSYATHIPTAAIVPGDTAICQGSTISFTAAPSGTSYLWSSGASTASINTGTADNYWVEILDVTGCNYRSNEITLTLLPVPAAPVISQVGNTLTASPAGFTYQWFLNTNPIAGATSQSYTVNSNGNYSVVITDINGCTNTSAFNFNTFGIEENTQEVQVYASQGNLYINIPGDELQQVTLYDALGKVVYDRPYTENIIPVIIPAGIYFARIKGSQKDYTRKLLF